MGPKKDQNIDKARLKTRNVSTMTEDSANMVTSATIYILTKFVMTKTALDRHVTRGILILANLVQGAPIIRKMYVLTLMLLLPVMTRLLMLLLINLQRNLHCLKTKWLPFKIKLII